MFYIIVLLISTSVYNTITKHQRFLFHRELAHPYVQLPLQ